MIKKDYIKPQVVVVNVDKEIIEPFAAMSTFTDTNIIDSESGSDAGEGRADEGMFDWDTTNNNNKWEI